MEAAFLSGFASASLQVLLEKIAAFALPEISLLMKVDVDLRKLQRSFFRIQAMVDFLEHMHFGRASGVGSSSSIKNAWQVWLQELKDLLYEADDFLDEIYLYFSKCSASHDPRMDKNNEVRDMLASSLKVTVPHKLSKLLNNLEDMSNEMNLFFTHGVDKIKTGQSFWDVDGGSTNDVARKSMMVNDNLIVGRENEVQEIIGMVHQSTQNLVVFPIVGIAGLGKTTLAQLIFNEFKEYTELSIWVSVSVEFDIQRIMKSIIEFFTLECCKLSEMNLIQAQVRQLLLGKKLMLVLDDYWSEKHGDWEVVSSLLNGGSPGSLVVLTTQSTRVSSIVGTVPAHQLQCLSNDDCWQLMKQRAFLNKNIMDMDRLERIGEEISRKCKGSPLEAKALGSVLYLKNTEMERGDIERSELWDLLTFKEEISPALLLSFTYLPSHLKKCFAYCSIFPPNHEFKKDDLVLLWMAEGFIQPVKETRLEDVASDYFDELSWRCFFQLSGQTNERYIMHDVIHLLAHMVSVDICLRMKLDDASQYSFPSGRNMKHSPSVPAT